MSYKMLITLGVVFGVFSACTAQAYGSSGCPASSIPSNIRVFGIPDTLLVSNNGQNSGFLVDLLNALQTQTGIPYTLTVRSDLTFGNQNANSSFDGSLVGALVNNQADLVGTDLTINSAREAVVDFLVPFSSYSLQILVNSQFGLNTPGLQYVITDNADLAFIKNSKNASIQAIYANVQAGLPGSVVTDDASGLAKVLSGNFAYVSESIFTNVAVAQNAGKVSVAPGKLGTFYFALAVQQGSALREKLNVALLQLAEAGTIQDLLNKYGVSS